MTDPATENFIESIRQLESTERKLLSEHQDIYEKFTAKRLEVIADKKKFGKRIPFDFSDDAIDKLSYRDIAGMYKDNIAKKIDAVKKIYEGENYRKTKENIEKAKTEAEKYSPEKHIEEFKAFDLERKAHNERKKQYDELRSRLAEIQSKNAELDHKQELLNTQSEGLTDNFAEDKIAKLLTDYDNAIDKNARDGITLDNDTSELKENYLKTNSAEFVNMRLALRKVKDMFAEGSTASKEDKMNYLEALKDFASDYVKIREAEFRPFASATRKYRIAFAKNLAQFAESAFNDMIAEDSNPQLENDAPMQEVNPEELVNSIKDSEHEISDEQRDEEFMRQVHSEIEKNIDDNAKREITNKIDEELKKIIPDNAQDIRMRDSNLIVCFVNGEEKTVSQSDFAAYIALKSVKVAAESVHADKMPDLLNKKDLVLLADSVQGSKAFTDVMLKMDADSKKNDFMLRAKDFGEITENLVTACLAERSAVKTKVDYTGEIKRRMNNILPDNFIGKKNLSADLIAKYIYLGTVARAANGFTKEQLGTLLSEKEMGKQLEYIKEKHAFRQLMEGLPYNNHTKDGVGKSFLNTAVSTYADGLMSMGADKHTDEILSQIENLSKKSNVQEIQKQSKKLI